jgi:hypothetical protein
MARSRALELGFELTQPLLCFFHGRVSFSLLTVQVSWSWAALVQAQAPAVPGIWRVPMPGLRLCRADLRSSVAVEPAQLLARHGPGHRIVVRSRSVVGIGRGHGRATRDLGTPSFLYAQRRTFYANHWFPIHHNVVIPCQAPDVVLVVVGIVDRQLHQ